MLTELEKYETRIAILDRIRVLECTQDAMPRYPHEGANWHSGELKTLREVLDKLK